MYPKKVTHHGMQTVALAMGTLKFHRFLVFWFFFWGFLVHYIQSTSFFSPSDSKWHDSEQNHWFLLGYRHCLAQSCGRGNILALPLDDSATKTAKKLCSTKCPDGPAVMESTLKMFAKVCAGQLQSRTSAVDPGILVRPCAVLDSAKLVAEGIRQVCHKKRANEGCDGILKCAFHGHHFALRHKLRMRCIIV